MLSSCQCTEFTDASILWIQAVSPFTELGCVVCCSWDLTVKSEIQGHAHTAKWKKIKLKNMSFSPQRAHFPGVFLRPGWKQRRSASTAQLHTFRQWACKSSWLFVDLREAALVRYWSWILSPSFYYLLVLSPLKHPKLNKAEWRSTCPDLSDDVDRHCLDTRNMVFFMMNYSIDLIKTVCFHSWWCFNITIQMHQNSLFILVNSKVANFLLLFFSHCCWQTVKTTHNQPKISTQLLMQWRLSRFKQVILHCYWFLHNVLCVQLYFDAFNETWECQ